MKRIICLMALAALTGCATQRTKLSETVDVDGAYTKTTEIKTRTFLDSRNELTKLKTSSTDRTQSVGMDGLRQEAHGTNVVAGVNAAGSLIGNAARAFMSGGL